MRHAKKKKASTKEDTDDTPLPKVPRKRLTPKGFKSVPSDYAELLSNSSDQEGARNALTEYRMRGDKHLREKDSK